MMYKQPITLLGFMGAGKSFLGKQLANVLNSDFVDTDDWIEAHQQKSIASIFRDEGEDTFRSYETEAMKKMLSAADNPKVIATGGGLPCFNNNIGWLIENSYSVYLKASPKLLLDRLKNEKDKRPLIQDKTEEEVLSFIGEKLVEREVFYHQANHIFYLTGNNRVDLDHFLSIFRTFYH